MPRFSRFYSATEAEALANIRQLLPKTTEFAPQFSNNDEEQLIDLLRDKQVFPSKPRADINQPIFRPPSTAQVLQRLLDVSSFSVTHGTVHRNKNVRYASSSEDSLEWKMRSQTPSSDDPSSRRTVPSPTLSLKVETSSISGDSLDHDLPHAVEHAAQKPERNLGMYPDYYASSPSDTLQTMDTQFSKWSYDLSEGSTAIPFVMAHAPAETHTKLVEIDRTFWALGDHAAVDTTAHADTTAAIVLDRFRKTDSQRSDPSRRTAKITKHSPDNHSDKSLSKRAAMIAKSQALKDDSLVVSKSASQRRSALHKKRKRRSIMPSPPPIARKFEPEPKLESSAEQTRPTILILNQNDDNQRREVDSALQGKHLDLDSNQHLCDLMAKLNRPKADDHVTEGRIVELDEETVEQTRNTHRLKGKARKKAKSGKGR